MRQTRLLATAMIAALAFSDSGPTKPARKQKRIKRFRGNKYRLCECGSFKPWANCCGKKDRP